MKTVNVGIIGGGLMGKEVASAFGRWFALNDFPVKVQLAGICDLNPQALDWYRQIPGGRLLTPITGNSWQIPGLRSYM